MAAPKTLKFADFPVYVEFVPSSGVYTLVCGIASRGITNKTNIKTDEVPTDCTNETLPATVSKAPQSKDSSISGSGKYARQSHKLLWDWWNNGTRLNVRIGYVGANTGEISALEGPAYLTQLDHSVEIGATLTCDITIDFDGTPTAVIAP
jgi:Phage tail tube protein